MVPICSHVPRVFCVKVTPQLFMAEFFPDELPEFMEPELHDIFSHLHGRHSREDAADTRLKLGQPVSNFTFRRADILRHPWHFKLSNADSLHLFIIPYGPAQDMLCKMPYQSAQMACRTWSATATLCPEVVDQVTCCLWFSHKDQSQ